MLLNGILVLLAIQLTSINAQTVNSSTTVDNANSNITVLQHQPIDKPGMFIFNLGFKSILIYIYIYTFSWLTEC
jgi:hypothetical protein